MRNPFTPTFGIVPPHLAGRQALLDDMGRAFENGVGDPNLSCLLIGPRGSGKTALLSCIAEEANTHGWIAANSAALPGMLEDIRQAVLFAASEWLEKKGKKQLKEISIGQFLGLSWDVKPDEQMNWRSTMTELIRKLNEQGIGLLVTVDEVTPDLEEMIQLVSDYQLMIRDGLQVALVMAGLPAQVTDLISHKRISFLRRARKRYLGTISDGEIERAYRKTIEEAGKSIGDDELLKAVSASAGFPYMMQLVGFAMWEESGEAAIIREQDVLRGIRQAEEEFRSGVLESTLRELSKGDLKFLHAMLEDKEYSRLSEIAKRMKKSSGYVSTYKKRLLYAGIIEEQPGQTYSIALPGFRDYLESR